MEPKLRAREIQAFSDFRSADGSFGETNATGGLTFKNGLYVGGTMSATSTSIAPDSVTVVGTGGNGFVAFAAQSSPPVQSLAHIYASPAGAIILGHSGSTAYAVEFNNGLLNANRVLHVPNKSGTIATTSDNVSQFTNDAGYVPSSRTLSAGVGLTGGGNLSADRSFVLGTPSSLAVGTGNSVSGTTHTHAITSSSNPGAAAVILATDTSGFLRLTRLGIGASPTQPLQVAGNAFIDASTANLYMKDTSTGFQVSATGVINLQTGNTLRTAPFTAGVEGWNISWDGDAEFNNVRVRGELAASVFKVSELSATAGTFGVFYSASTLTVDCLTAAVPGAGMSITAKNSDAGAMLFGVGDKVRIKSWTGTAVADVWATIQSRTNNGPDTTYSAIFESGTASAYFVAGTAVVDYGPSGSGFITLSADGTVGATPNITMATHAGSPWSAQTVFYKAGNLDLS